MPQILLRTPYTYHFQSEETHPFSFVEDISKSKDFLWGNAAFGLVTCMTRAFAEEYWASNITGWYGGRVGDLPLAVHKSDDGVQQNLHINGHFRPSGGCVGGSRIRDVMPGKGW